MKHVWWRCEGSSIGSYSIGPKGHPADSEYDIWKLKNFRIDGAFSKDGLEIKVVADTDRGDEQEWDHTNYGIYPELNVKFKFFVEKEALQVFLGIQNEHLPEYMEALEKLE